MLRPEGFSFFVTSKYSTWQIRGIQMCEYLGGKLNPDNGYENDVCIWVKMNPQWSEEPRHSWYDLVDPRDVLVRNIKKHTSGNLIAISIPQFHRFQKIFDDREVVFIPEHHCNYEREKRPERPVKMVGCIGSKSNAIQYSHDKITKMLADMGLQWKFTGFYKRRQNVIDFYKKIDIQICYRTAWEPEKGRMEDKNPLKLENAGSFGIPTVSYPEVSYVAEWKDECLYGSNMEEIMTHVKRLKEDDGFYREMSARALDKSEQYHIKHISKKYMSLLGEDKMDLRVRITARLYDKMVKINGKDENVYGLASLGVRPSGMDMGTEILTSFKRLAGEHGKWGVVAFTDERTWPFYQKNGWYRHQTHKSNNYPDRIVMTSKPCEKIEVTERW